MELPVIGAAARRIGAVDGRRDTCADILRAGGAVLTFPEGVKALARPFRERYQLKPFGHGFIHVALATGAPIIPVAVIGAEEEAPLLANPGWLARLVGTPVAPLTPTVVFPLPVKYRLHFGTPLRFRGPATLEVVARHVATVRSALQTLIQQGLTMRRHVFF
jgi:1-acyl-sn-glycerol-3-phosphate acyltransferase